MKPTRIVVIGGGFAGVNFIRQLAGNEAFEITLVDRNNYNFFPPLLYQVATGFLTMSNISYPFRKLFRKHKNVHFRLAELIALHPEQNQVETSTGIIGYDMLVLAMGTETNYFGMENVKRLAVPMKTVSDALALRNYLLLQLERASIEQDPEERKRLMTIVVAGGGPTGVEISGMLAEMRKRIFRLDYPELDINDMDIHLVDALPTVLAPMSKASQTDTLSYLQQLNVKVTLNKQVKDYVNEEVLFADGSKIHTRTLIWTAGVSATPLRGLPESCFGKGKRLLVDIFNKVAGTANIYAIGDNCLQSGDPAFVNGHPQLAQVAIQQGRVLAKNLLKKGESWAEFRYNDKGSMAIVGNFKAVADLPKLHFKGFIAYMMWLAVHLFSLTRYRNRVKTLMNWAWAFFTRDQALRYIVREKKSS
ncbi:NAD(P)/FAD-dependent oxidoreductase [Filimonas effusa]|uniref:NADH:ubiquinone reductase (non-electrogenic) n=1 Tax=Filimonas effusa TaxID=2508721 RepID=A0A4Q1CZ06_9BACT|nr:NAD(P)/FAD-dependent oxidoreductase [Filimonas effusa]RXK80560.1 NAD(P)/FAD-dependent oxidoreductase [Filimonas effusa]